ncbi:hypothetical protein Gotur_022658 [Gossypium turneri]
MDGKGLDYRSHFSYLQPIQVSSFLLRVDISKLIDYLSMTGQPCILCNQRKKSNWESYDCI